MTCVYVITWKAECKGWKMRNFIIHYNLVLNIFHQCCIANKNIIVFKAIYDILYMYK